MNKFLLITLLLAAFLTRGQGKNYPFAESLKLLSWDKNERSKISLSQIESLSEQLTPLQKDSLKSELYDQLQKYQFDLSQQELSQYLNETIAMSATPTHFDSHGLLRAVADYRFDRLSIFLQKTVTNENINLQNTHISMAIEILKYHNYYLNIPQSNWSKLLEYIKSGRWHHIVQSLLTTHVNALLKAVFFVALPLLVLLLITLKKRLS